MKKSLALVLAAVMILAVCGTAFAARDWADTPTGKVTITGLETGDHVYLYKVIGWDNDSATNNWAPLDAYSGVNGISEFGTMTAAKATAIAAIAVGQPAVNDKELAAADNGTYEKTGLEVGMYVAVVQAAGDTVYNPMIVSVNFGSGENTASDGTVDADSTLAGTVAKKKPITATKTVDADETDDADDAKTVKAGDKVPFIVTTELPNYAANWTNPEFIVTDTLSSNLELDTTSIKVWIGDPAGTAYTETSANVLTITPSASGYVITFAEAILKQVKTDARVTIKYEATVKDEVAQDINVNRENNTVKVEYSNNPFDSSSHKEIKERTNHYTFSIDADIFGTVGGQDFTSELIKIGVDDAGNVITKWLTRDVTTWESKTKLQGAEFRLVKTGTNGTYEDSDKREWTATSGANGQIVFEGLEAGTYKLYETKAPDGYVKDNNAVNGIDVVIEATFQDGVADDGTIEHHLLKSYTITIGGVATSTYTIENASSDTVTTSAVSSDNETFPIVNTHGLELPSTGGIGTTIFYVAGLLMVLGAGTVLVARRKADQE